MKEAEIMTLRDVAKYLRMHYMSVYRHAKAGRLPMIKLHGRWICKRSSLDRYLESLEVSNARS